MDTYEQQLASFNLKPNLTRSRKTLHKDTCASDIPFFVLFRPEFLCFNDISLGQEFDTSTHFSTNLDMHESFLHDGPE